MDGLDLSSLNMTKFDDEHREEAATAVLQHGFDSLGLERIVTSADVPNVASIRVMEKLGMQFDKQETVNGLELVFYSIRREAFETPASTSAA